MITPWFGADSWLARLLIAIVLGGLVGLEREFHGRPAGLRTHMLVCLGATLMTLAGLLIVQGTPIYAGGFRPDATRIAAGIVTGIGFLGAGAIVRTGSLIRGLTTAACIWFSAGLGISIGFGFLTIAVAATALELVTVIGLSYVEDRLPPCYYRDVAVVAQRLDLADFENACRRIFHAAHISTRDVETEIVPEPPQIKLIFHLKLRGKETRNEIMEQLQTLNGVRQVAWHQHQQEP